MPTSPKVSVHIVTYNQASFIAKALDSILMQRGALDYEIVIGDDCSTDGTTEIIRDYQSRWPGKIKPLFRTKNLGPGPNAVGTLEHCRGEYIAFLEGDDYWTDPDKMRLQVDYLDKNTGAAFVHHTVQHISSPSGQSLGEFPCPRFRTDHADPRDLAMVNFIQTCAVMLRRSCLPSLDAAYRDLKIGDWPLFVLLSQQGWIGYQDRTMAHYRVHANNGWNNRRAEYKIRAMEDMALYLLTRVERSSQDDWRNTLLAVAFKDLAISIQSLATGKTITKLKKFINYSVKFRKPFWLLNSLWPYYKANNDIARFRRSSAMSDDRNGHSLAQKTGSKAATEEIAQANPV
jgi:glycosyltransferase involved in cell wall biosynthesis